MLKALLGDILNLISLNAMACVLVFLVFNLWRTLHRRRLAIWELMLYIAGAGVAMALPQCFHWQTHRSPAMAVFYHEVRWISLSLTWLALVPIVFMINRTSRR